MSKIVKKILKILLIILIVVILAAAAYVAYVFISYHRLGNAVIDVEGEAPGRAVETKKTYKIVSYNVGFGAYEPDFDFFMDGGKQSWAKSRDGLIKNLKNIADFLKEQDADFYLIEEVDFNSTRTYHVDERQYIVEKLDGFSRTFAQNYDSPFLLYPFYQPHGASKSGIMTFSRFGITSASRVELPVEKGFTKFLDLDRCYSKNRIPASDGKELILYCFHLSAYTSDGKIATEQLKLMIADMEEEYKKGNYCVAGGDFNKDILGDSSKYFGKADKEYTWAQPIPEEIFDDTHVKLAAPLDEKNPVPSCRNCDAPYHEGQYVVTVDGFLYTDNVKVKNPTVIDTGFKYSDHNPVTMEFSLKMVEEKEEETSD